MIKTHDFIELHKSVATGANFNEKLSPADSQGFTLKPSSFRDLFPFTSTNNQNVARDKETMDYVESLRDVVRPFDTPDEVVGHEKALLAIQKSFSAKNLLKRRISEKAGINAILLAGPPGVGKSAILSSAANLIANSLRRDVSVFHVSAATLMSKWVGESENTIKCLYEVANKFGPSLVSIDEVDGIMRSRTDGEDEHVRRFKTTFLLTLQGVVCYRNVLTIAGTNKGDELDIAFLRRFQQVFVLPLPNDTQRLKILEKAFVQELDITLASLSFPESDFIRETEGFTGDDIIRSVKMAALEIQNFYVNGRKICDKDVIRNKAEFENPNTNIELVEEELTWDIYLKFGIKCVVSSACSEELKKMDTWVRKFNIESSCYDDQEEFDTNQSNQSIWRNFGDFIDACGCCCIDWCYLFWSKLYVTMASTKIALQCSLKIKSENEICDSY